MRLTDFLPGALPGPVVEAGAFCYAAMGLDHGHIHALCEGLRAAGASLRWVHDRDVKRAETLAATVPGVRVAPCEDEIFEDARVALVVSATRAEPVGRPGDPRHGGGQTLPGGQGTHDHPGAACSSTPGSGRNWAKVFCVLWRTYGKRGRLADRCFSAGRLVHMEALSPHCLNAPQRPD